MEYAKARGENKKIVEKENRGIWEEVVQKTNGDFDGGMKQMWIGIEGIISKRVGKTD